MSSAGSTSSSLLARVKASDQQAWKRLLKVYSPLVYYWCRHRAQLSPEDAADVMQEIFLAVSQAIGRYRHDRPGDSFRGWLRVIATNKIRDHARKGAADPACGGGADLAAVVPAVGTSGTVVGDESDPSEPSVVRLALEAIEGDFQSTTWQAFWRAKVEGHPRAEIAADLGMSVAAVNQACYRIGRRLREELGGLIE